MLTSKKIFDKIKLQEVFIYDKNIPRSFETFRKNRRTAMKSSNSFSKKEILTAVSIVLFRTVTGIVPALVFFDIKLPDELRNTVYSTAGTVVSAALILLYTVISAIMGKKKSDGFALGMGASLFLGLLLLPLVWWPELLLSLAITGADGGLVVPLMVLSAIPIFVYILFRKCFAKTEA